MPSILARSRRHIRSGRRRAQRTDKVLPLPGCDAEKRILYDPGYQKAVFGSIEWHKGIYPISGIADAMRTWVMVSAPKEPKKAIGGRLMAPLLQNSVSPVAGVMHIWVMDYVQGTAEKSNPVLRQRPPQAGQRTIVRKSKANKHKISGYSSFSY